MGGVQVEGVQVLFRWEGGSVVGGGRCEQRGKLYGDRRGVKLQTFGGGERS